MTVRLERGERCENEVNERVGCEWCEAREWGKRVWYKSEVREWVVRVRRESRLC